MHENKKICMGCGKRRRLGKFGYQARRSDHKNPYCRDCMREFTIKYKKSKKGKIKQAKAVKKYIKKNKKKLLEYHKQYRLKNKKRREYDKISKESTECVNIFDDDLKKDKILKINNKDRKIPIIVIDPKPKREL